MRMRNTLKAGFLACVLFLCLSGLLLGYAQNNLQPDQQETTGQTDRLEQSNQQNQTESSSSSQLQKPLPPPDFSLSSTHVFVYDTGKDTLLYTAGEQEERIAPASLTKLFSAYVALQYVQPDTVLTAGDEVNWIDPDSSRAFIYKGQRVTATQCVKGMLMQSGNDAAYILAVAAGRAIQGDPSLSAKAALSAFIGKMNDAALRLGLKNTHFANPDGIDAPGHYTTMADLMVICRLAMGQSLIRQCASSVRETVTYVSGETVNWKNTNELLHPDSEFYCPTACGLKTGSTKAAGKCLVSAFWQDDGFLIIATLDSPEEDDRYTDTLNLYRHYTQEPA